AFIVGNSVGLSFSEYLHLLSPGALLAVAGLIAILPLSFRSVWRARVPDARAEALPRIQRPLVMTGCLAVLGVMIALFVVGESLPHPVAPPAGSLGAAPPRVV